MANLNDVLDFMDAMNERYKDKNILWDTTYILEGITNTRPDILKYQKEKNPEVFGDILGKFAAVTDTVSHLVEMHKELKIGYPNEIQIISNLWNEAQDFILKAHEDETNGFCINQFEKLLKECFSSTYKIWIEETKKINLKDLKRNMNVEEITLLAKDLLNYNPETDHEKLVPFFIKLCA